MVSLFRPAKAKNSALTRFGEAPKFAEGLYRLSEKTYAWLVPNGSWGETNIGLIDGGNESALIDTCWDLKYTQEIIEAADTVLARAPIEYVINTHADGDHCWGNQFFAGKNIIGTEACVAQMHHLNPLSLHALKHGGRLLRRLPGLCLGINQFGHYMAEMFAPYDFRDIRITPPTQAFNERHELNIGHETVVLYEVGPGHTDGDAIVHVPDQGVVYAGDILFVGVTPVLWAGPLTQLQRGLDVLLSTQSAVIVPGHGPLASLSDVQAVQDYWSYVHEAIHRCWQQDMTPFEAARHVALSTDFQSRVFAQWDSPERLVTNACTLYRHWGAKMRSLPGKLGVMDIMREQALLALAMPAATPRVMHRRF
jgi:cyclase